MKIAPVKVPVFSQGFGSLVIKDTNGAKTPFSQDAYTDSGKDSFTNEEIYEKLGDIGSVLKNQVEQKVSKNKLSGINLDAFFKEIEDVSNERKMDIVIEPKFAKSVIQNQPAMTKREKKKAKKQAIKDGALQVQNTPAKKGELKEIKIGLRFKDAPEGKYAVCTGDKSNNALSKLLLNLYNYAALLCINAEKFEEK